MKLFTMTFLMTLIAASLYAQDKPRIFVTESQSDEVKGHGGGIFAGGSRPQTAEIIKNFEAKCECIITSKQEKADYTARVDHEGGKGIALKDTKFVIFNRDGDSIKSGSTRSIGNAVKDACAAITKDWKEKKK